jgi:hypothetical protein
MTFISAYSGDRSLVVAWHTNAADSVFIFFQTKATFFRLIFEKTAKTKLYINNDTIYYEKFSGSNFQRLAAPEALHDVRMSPVSPCQSRHLIEKKPVGDGQMREREEVFSGKKEVCYGR